MVDGAARQRVMGPRAYHMCGAARTGYPAFLRLMQGVPAQDAYMRAAAVLKIKVEWGIVHKPSPLEAGRGPACSAITETSPERF